MLVNIEYLYYQIKTYINIIIITLINLFIR